MAAISVKTRKKRIAAGTVLTSLACMTAAAVPSSAASLRPPATALAWMLGDWNCKAQNYDSGRPQLEKGGIRAHFFADASGLTIHSRSASSGHQSTDRITWNARTSHWLDVGSGTSDRHLVKSALTAEDVDVDDTGMTFSGFQKMDDDVVRTQVITARSGPDSFTERTDLDVNGDWQTVEMVYCKRATFSLLDQAESATVARTAR